MENVLSKQECGPPCGTTITGVDLSSPPFLPKYVKLKFSIFAKKNILIDFNQQFFVS